jgi:hypothetical protein
MRLFQPKIDLKEVRQTLEETARLVEALGKKAKPYRDPALPLLQALGARAARRALFSLNTYRDVLKEAVAQSEGAETRKILWRMIQRLGFVPEPDLLDKISWTRSPKKMSWRSIPSRMSRSLGTLRFSIFAPSVLRN